LDRKFLVSRAKTLVNYSFGYLKLNKWIHQNVGSGHLVAHDLQVKKEVGQRTKKLENKEMVERQQRLSLLLLVDM